MACFRIDGGKSNILNASFFQQFLIMPGIDVEVLTLAASAFLGVHWKSTDF